MWEFGSGDIKVDPDELWYFVNDVNEDSYSPYKISKRINEFIGDGKQPPTPEEAVMYLNKYPDASLESNLYFERRVFNQTDSKSGALPAGVYKYAESAGGRFPERLVKINLREDKTVGLGNVFDEVENNINAFLEHEHIYRDHGMMFKLGILLWGPPGNGKTTLIRKILHDIVPKDSVIIFIEDKFPSSFFLHKVQKSLRKRLTVFVFEELATTLDRWAMSRILDFLDGETSVDKSIVLGTTNYPDKIPGNIVNRPSRFDKIIKFDNPKDTERKLLVEHFLKREATAKDVELTKDLSIADIKETCLEVLLKKLELADAIGNLKKRATLCKKNFAESKDVGFSSF